MPRTVMTDAQWKRLAELRERLRARDERERERREASWARRIRYTAGDRRAEAYFARDRRATIAPEVAATLLRIPVEALLEATKGQPFFLDFGRSGDGSRRRYFRSVELVRFAARHGRSSSTRGARPAIAQAA